MKNSEEKLTPANLDKVIHLLEPTEEGVKPVTKKLACELLGIAYNTTRLASLIEKHKEKKADTARRRAEKRGTPATSGEVQFVAERYLEGGSIESISESLYRSTAFVKGIIEKYSIPQRANAHNYFKPELIPEGAMRERFKVGEVVYSARYDSLARIDGELFQKNQWVYRIWLLSEKWLQFGYQEAAELASLEHLTKLGISL